MEMVERSSARRLRCRIVCITGVAVLCGSATASLASVIDIADCGQLLNAADANRYRLVADVDCSQERDPVLTVPSGSTVRLDGHTLTGADVFCIGKCRVTGPGTIEAGGVLTADRAVVRRVQIVGSPVDGVLATNDRGNARVTLVDSSVTDCAENGVVADRHAKLLRSTVMRNGRNGVAVSREETNDCARGRITAWGSMVLGNGIDGDCGEAETCADVAACDVRGAKLHTTECDRSRQMGSGMPGKSCGLCALD